jgi:predicted transcriptional regulator YdeE
MTKNNIAQQYEVKAGLDHVSGFVVAGITAIIDGGQDNAAEQINELWGNFFAQQIGKDLEGRIDDTIYAVYSDYQGDYTKPYRLSIGYRIKSDAAHASKLHYVAVQEGDYAMLSAAGEQPKALIETWKAVWQGDLPRLYQTDFEVYGARFFEEGVHEILVFVGINQERVNA